VDSLFEQHDAANWAAFARQANAILEPIRQRRGLYQYTVVCDSTTNTPDLINQNIMAGKIFVQPVKTIEFIEVEFTINAAGEVEFAE
jgi:phage tail sheath protein FI